LAQDVLLKISKKSPGKEWGECCIFRWERPYFEEAFEKSPHPLKLRAKYA
jgi:hypothetical protein